MSLPSQTKPCDDWGFRITQEGCGFQIRFASGYILSVQFSMYHYCANRQRYEAHRPLFPTLNEPRDIPPLGVIGSPNAEVAIIDPNGNFVPWHDDDVSGYVIPEDMLVMAMACGLWSKQKEDSHE